METELPVSRCLETERLETDRLETERLETERLTEINFIRGKNMLSEFLKFYMTRFESMYLYFHTTF